MLPCLSINVLFRSSCFFLLLVPKAIKFVYLLKEPGPRFNGCVYCFLVSISLISVFTFICSSYDFFPFELSLSSLSPKFLSCIMHFCSFLFLFGHVELEKLDVHMKKNGTGVVSISMSKNQLRAD